MNKLLLYLDGWRHALRRPFLLPKIIILTSKILTATVKKMDTKFIAQKLINHEERLERIEDKIDKILTKEEFFAIMDKVMTSLERLDQERLSSINRVDRQDKEISQLKEHVGLAESNS